MRVECADDGTRGRGRLLLVTHSYPPRPSPASRRPFGLAKYLRRMGYRVIVLTSDAWGDSTATEPEGDVIQARDLIGSRLNWRQRNIRAYEGLAGASYSGQQSVFGRMLVPDIVGVTWLPFALGPAIALRDEVDAVLTTSGPESTHLVGLAMRRRGVPWVADLRDGWRFEPYRDFPLGFEERAGRRHGAPRALAGGPRHRGERADHGRPARPPRVAGGDGPQRLRRRGAARRRVRARAVSGTPLDRLHGPLGDRRALARRADLRAAGAAAAGAPPSWAGSRWCSPGR